MRATHRFPLFIILVLMACSLLGSLPAMAQQVYHGDGATNDGNGGWSTSGAGNDKCLKCHGAGSLADVSGYLQTGHKNALRKVTPGKPWAAADGTLYSTTDDHYGSGSIYDWNTGTVSVGACLVPNPLDPSCAYSHYGATQNLFYILGGWWDKEQLNTVFQNGFSGEQYPNGNFDCARCHATGYRFDATGPEPTYNGVKIPDAQFRRIPSSMTSGTSSWFQDGIQCERCHIADNGIRNHTATGAIAGGVPTKPISEIATALCLQCHRQETVDTTAQTITPRSSPVVSDRGSCSDGISKNRATCIAQGGTWRYAPYFRYESGLTFLNSPHARFSGTLSQNRQNSSDLSVRMVGSYDSYFQDLLYPPFNGGCTQCHDPHQSLTQSSATPFRTRCVDCHDKDHYGIETIKHPKGDPYTPYPEGSASDDSSYSCAVCHMQIVGGRGTPMSHLFRISTDPNYSTFPTASEYYDPSAPKTTPNTASDGVISGAIWSDADMACGQCHVGSGSVFSAPPPDYNYPLFNKAYLAAWAKGIHGTPTTHTPIFWPSAGIYTTLPVVTLSDTTPNATIYYTTDGSTPSALSTQYSGPITLTGTTALKAIAMAPTYKPSAVAVATYTLQAMPPTFSPGSGTYTAPPLVTLADASHGVTIYFTTDGSTPTTSSTPYTAPIQLTGSTTIKAIAAGNGYTPSTMSAGVYTVSAPTPTFSPLSGTYTMAQSVTLGGAPSGASIYYTTDGSTPTASSARYTAPIAVTQTTTIRAVIVTEYGTGPVASATYTLRAGTPTFSPSSGTYYNQLSVSLASVTPGVTFYYTTDGSTPTTTSTLYSGPILVTTTTNVKAIAVASGFNQSLVGSANYNLQVKTPTFSPSAGTYSSSRSVTLSTTTSGASIYYTTDGSTPTTSSTLYSAAILVSQITTIKAIGVLSGYGTSTVATATYNIQAAVPTVSLASGTYTGPQSLTLADSTPDATIYYTTDGSTPTTSSTQYTGAITVSVTTTLKAIAVAPGSVPSAVVSRSYTIR